jgi:hypothetical protein
VDHSGQFPYSQETQILGEVEEKIDIKKKKTENRENSNRSGRDLIGLSN